MNLKQLFNLFVGNKDSHIEWIENRWVRIFAPLTPHKIKKHLAHEIAVGCYPIYIKNESDYCKWICIDIDSHYRVSNDERERLKKEFPKNWKLEYHKLIKKYKKRIDGERKAEQKKFCDHITNNWKEYLLSDKFLYEDSGGGFHIWIFPEMDTPLEDCGRYIELIKPKISKLYKEYFPGNGSPEIYPKQYSTSHLEEKCGNGVRMPFGKNIGKDYITNVIKADIKTTPVSTLSSLYTGPSVINIKEDVGKREKEDVFDKQDIKTSLEFWYHYPLIRPCFKDIMDGQTQTLDRHGHKMRMAMAHELNHHKVPKYVIINAFENQFDFDSVKSLVQINSVLRNKNGDWRYSCKKIKDLGYCTKEECNYDFKQYRKGKYKIRYNR